MSFVTSDDPPIIVAGDTLFEGWVSAGVIERTDVSVFIPLGQHTAGLWTQHGVYGWQRANDEMVRQCNELSAATAYRQVFAGDEKTVSVDTPYVVRRSSGPIAVLTSGLTASAGEASAIFFRALPNARSFGAPTVGLTTFNVRKTLPDGAFLDITNAVDVDRSGNAYDGPIVPDEPITIDWAQISVGNDASLQAASSWLRSQPGCAS